MQYATFDVPMKGLIQYDTRFLTVPKLKRMVLSLMYTEEEEEDLQIDSFSLLISSKERVPSQFFLKHEEDTLSSLGILNGRSYNVRVYRKKQKRKETPPLLENTHCAFCGKSIQGSRRWNPSELPVCSQCIQTIQNA